MEEFEAHRGYLRAVAYRMLGSASDAEDAVQEAWLRLARAGSDGVDNLRAWLTTVVARVCLDMLRARTVRREVAIDEPPAAVEPDPEQEAVLADSVGLALQVVLDTLTPAERLAFVLHDLFGVPFDEIAAILGRSVPAAKMLASRARRRVRQSSVDVDRPGQRAVVSAFLAAARDGDFAALLDLLDPDVTARADAAALPGVRTRVRGADPVARQALAFSRRAGQARVGLVDGAPAIVVATHGRPVLVITFAIANRRITAIEIVTGPDRIARLTVSSLT